MPTGRVAQRVSGSEAAIWAVVGVCVDFPQWAMALASASLEWGGCKGFPIPPSRACSCAGQQAAGWSRWDACWVVLRARCGRRCGARGAGTGRRSRRLDWRPVKSSPRRCRTRCLKVKTSPAARLAETVTAGERRIVRRGISAVAHESCGHTEDRLCAATPPSAADRRSARRASGRLSLSPPSPSVWRASGVLFWGLRRSKGGRGGAQPQCAQMASTRQLVEGDSSALTGPSHARRNSTVPSW